MELWMELTGVLVLISTGSLVGHRLSRTKGHWWLLGYGPALIVVVSVAVARRFQSLAVLWPFDLLLWGRLEFLLMAVAIPVLCLPLLRRCRNRRQRQWMAALTYLAVGGSVLPAFVGPALAQYRLQQLTNQYGNDGLCRQQTAYTCGPAAAVIALERLRLQASEGALAVAARTSPLSGTDESTLARTLSERYGRWGLHAAVERWRTVDDLADAGGAIVAIRYELWVDHYVAVLEATPTEVTVGDPMHGIRIFTGDDFRQIARPIAILLRRHPIPVTRGSTPKG